jgi:hypothetical protein
MLWVPSLNAHITTGDFLAAEQEDGNVLSVCRVISVLHPNVMRVTWWLKNEELSARQLQHLPPVDVSYNNLRKCRIKEVTERVLAIGTIQTCQVRDLAFVFHAVTLEHDIVNCAGMVNVFFTRFRYDVNDNLVGINVGHHYPFSNAVVESFPCRIWWSILYVKESVMKLLCDRKQYQSMKKSVAFQFSLESWYYLKGHIHHCVTSNYYKNQTYKHVHCDLTVSSSSGRTMVTLVRIDSPDSMRSACNLFGITFGIGIRNKPPNKNEAPRSIHFGDIANLVDVGLPENAALDHREREKEFVAAQGIDFIYDDSSRTLKIRIRHSRVYAQNDSVSTKLNLNLDLLQHIVDAASVNNEGRRWRNQISPGTFFLRNGALMEVLRVDGDDVTILSDNGDEVIINILEAEQLLEEYIG